MGVSGSTPTGCKEGSHSSAQQVYDQYRLYQDGLQICSITASVTPAQEGAGAGAASQEVHNDGLEGNTAPSSTLIMVQENDGELTFEAQCCQPALTGSGASSAHSTSSVTWICDPAAARKTASASLIRIPISEHDEQLRFSFGTRLLLLEDHAHAPDPAATLTLALACTDSPDALERVLAERKRAVVGCQYVHSVGNGLANGCNTTLHSYNTTPP